MRLGSAAASGMWRPESGPRGRAVTSHRQERCIFGFEMQDRAVSLSQHLERDTARSAIFERKIQGSCIAQESLAVAVGGGAESRYKNNPHAVAADSACEIACMAVV